MYNNGGKNEKSDQDCSFIRIDACNACSNHGIGFFAASGSSHAANDYMIRQKAGCVFNYGRDRQIKDIKTVYDFAGNEFYVVECVPTGYYIYNVETDTIVESSERDIAVTCIMAGLHITMSWKTVHIGMPWMQRKHCQMTKFKSCDRAVRKDLKQLKRVIKHETKAFRRWCSTPATKLSDTRSFIRI